MNRSLVVEPPDKQRARMAAACAVLGCEMRLRILEVLARNAGTLHVEAIAEAVGISQPTASYHLMRLLQVGFVSFEKGALHHYYSISHERMTDMLWAILERIHP